MKQFSPAKIFLMLFTGALLACSGRPSGVLSQEKMQDVLWDVAMAGEFANGYIYYTKPMENRVAVNDKLLSEIYRIHGISEKEFEKSLRYYKDHPKQFMVILDSITAKQTGVRPGDGRDPSITSPPTPGGINPPTPVEPRPLDDAPAISTVPQ